MDEGLAVDGFEIERRFAVDLAMEFGNRMHIRCIWKTFGECWDIKPEVLRSAYNRALGQQQFCKMVEKIRKIIEN